MEVTVTPGVRRTPLVVAATPDAVRVDRLLYPPGGHTHWHLHTGEQVLYGERGRGWVQFDGAERAPLGPGAVVHVAVGRKHWHGATPLDELVHVAVTAGGDTVWFGEVTAEEYLRTGAADELPADEGPADDAGAVVSAFIAALERQDLEAALQYLTEDVVYDNVPIGPVTGHAAVRATLSGALGRAERVEWVVRQQVARGDVVLNERLDRFLVSGRWIEVPVAGCFAVRAGRIAQWRDYFDLQTYRSQLGAG